MMNRVRASGIPGLIYVRDQSGFQLKHDSDFSERAIVDKILVTSGSPFESSIGFSRAVRTGNLITVSGTAPIGEDGKTVCRGDAYGQTRRCLEIIRTAIEKAGGKLEHAVRTRIYITDRSIWPDVGKAHGEVFSRIRPASTLVVVAGFVDPDWLVELEADCMID